MTNFGADETTLADKLRTVELYVQTQGDKFHPLSDTLLERFEVVSDPETTEAAVLEALISYEGSCAPKLLQYHSYHIGRLREMLSDEYYS